MAMLEAFRSLSRDDVANCWLKSGIISVKQATEFCTAAGRPIPKNYSTIAVASACSPEEVQLLVSTEQSTSNCERK